MRALWSTRRLIITPRKQKIIFFDPKKFYHFSLKKQQNFRTIFFGRNFFQNTIFIFGSKRLVSIATMLLNVFQPLHRVLHVANVLEKKLKKIYAKSILKKTKIFNLSDKYLHNRRRSTCLSKVLAITIESLVEVASVHFGYVCPVKVKMFGQNCAKLCKKRVFHDFSHL